MAITWKAKICSGMDVVEKIKFIKQGIDDDGNKVMIYDHRGKSWTFDEEGWVYIMA